MSLMRSPAVSPVSVQPQFQVLGPRMSNLDKCARCGLPRGAHGADWTCSSGRRRPGARLAVVAAGGVLALAGVLVLALTSTTYGTAGTLGAAGCLAGLTLLVCVTVLYGRD